MFNKLWIYTIDNRLKINTYNTVVYYILQIFQDDVEVSYGQILTLINGRHKKIILTVILMIIIKY